MNTSVPHIFANITARTPKAIKAAATTMTRGLTLMEEGYCFLPAGAPGAYTVTSPEGKTYQVIYNEAQGQFWCECEAHNNTGICKHLICLMLNQEAIDRTANFAIAIHNAVATMPHPYTQPAPAAAAYDASDWK